MKWTVLMALAGSVALGGPAHASDPTPAGHHEVLALVAAQGDAWNRGDLHGFLAYYQDSPDTVFVSGAHVEKGFAPIRARYLKRYGTSRETMGVLRFADLQLVSATADTAVVSGSWAVTTGDRTPHGRFTLVWKRIGAVWRIVYDHTSVAQGAPAASPAAHAAQGAPAAPSNLVPISEVQSIPGN